jgi:hypothetical protein
MTRELDFSEGIYCVALLETTFSDHSSYGIVVDTKSNFNLMSRLEELAKIPEKSRIIKVYDFTDSKGFDEIHRASQAMNRGEEVDLENICPYRNAAPKIWADWIEKFNRKYS